MRHVNIEPAGGAVGRRRESEAVQAEPRSGGGTLTGEVQILSEVLQAIGKAASQLNVSLVGTGGPDTFVEASESRVPTLFGPEPCIAQDVRAIRGLAEKVRVELERVCDLVGVWRDVAPDYSDFQPPRENDRIRG